MNIFLRILIVSTWLFTGCSNGSGQSNQEQKPVNDGVHYSMDELGNLINITQMEYDTSQIVCWRVYKMGGDSELVPGPSDYYLIASFKLRSIDTSRLTVNTFITEPLKKTSVYYKDWLPLNVHYLFESSTAGIKVPTYNVRPFAKSPFLNGFYCISPDNYLYLFMSTQ